jgi:threonine synthase
VPELGILSRFAHRLDLPELSRPLSLGEGSTPLVSGEALLEPFDFGGELYLKIEGGNPTGSFKDRGMAAAISVARAQGARGVICASTGHAAASAAAYSARAGLPCFAVTPHEETARGTLAQVQAHGATVLSIESNLDAALALVLDLAAERELLVVDSTNPHRIEGESTVSYEVFDQLGGRTPEYHALPVGHGGNFAAHWLGYTRLRDESRAFRLPRMLGFQAHGAAPLALGRPCPVPDTVATAIRIGNPVRGQDALRVRDDSGGTIEAVSDEDILSSQSRLARELGIFCETASAASVAGVLQSLARGALEPKSTIVCTLTGHGLGGSCVLRSSPIGAPLPPDCTALLEAIDRALPRR